MASVPSQSAAAAKERTLIAAIADEDSITGLLLAGIGNIDKDQKKNFLVVDNSVLCSVLKLAVGNC